MEMAVQKFFGNEARPGLEANGDIVADLRIPCESTEKIL